MHMPPTQVHRPAHPALAFCRWFVISAVAAALAGNVGTAGAQKGGDPSKGAPRVAIERRGAVASRASIRLFGAISSLRIIGWDRDSLVVTGTMPQEFVFDGGLAS